MRVNVRSWKITAKIARINNIMIPANRIPPMAVKSHFVWNANIVNANVMTAVIYNNLRKD
jgi:hypothetical protein